jgi:hypothetical protein
MNQIINPVLSSIVKRTSISTYIIITVLCLVLGASVMLPVQWLLISTLTVLAFFYFLKKFSFKWSFYSDTVFRKKLFRTALIIRVFIVLFLYAFFSFMTGEPYEFFAADSLNYHDMGVNIAGLIVDYKLNFIDKIRFLSISDSGYPVFLGFLYLVFFNSVILVRLVHALLGALTTVLIYDLTKRNFSEATGRLAGIIYMLLPSLIYYCGLHLKETVMIYLLVAFINISDKLMREQKVKTIFMVLLVLSGASLFLFRTVLAVCAIFSLFTALLFTSKRISGIGRKLIIGIWFVAGGLVLVSSAVFEEIEFYVNKSDTSQQQQMQHFSTRESGNKYAKYGKASIFIPLILVAPFPTLVNTGQQNLMMLGGALYIRNILVFFVIIALLIMYKRKVLRDYILILAVLFSYLVILASSGFALSERFHIPALPFLVIFIAFGINNIDKKMLKYHMPYLLVIALLILGWNWFKLAGRGLI